ncbi:MAG: cation:proton antiporter [Alphaproteobacteria bacterium]|nr:cation:proton antiporter [Alphaproteobacteria bacterium]MDE2336452.1 cation:proton antiporter [Alphaproteobacteria bacterium]
MDVLHHFDKLTSIALVTTAALLCGLGMIRLRQPAIVGYILCGVVLGPTGLEVVSNTASVQTLADLGVIMLLFLIGMEMSLRGFRKVYKTALSAAALQIALSVGLAFLAGMFLHWSFARVLVLGFAIALSSTAVAIKMLEETDDLKTQVGRITVSVLIAQDLAVIPILLVVSALGTGPFSSAAPQAAAVAAKMVFAVGFLGFIVWFLSRREKLTLPFTDWIAGRPEVLPLAALAFCFTCAAGAGLLGLSTAYGAFAAGLVIGNSNVRAALHTAAVPIQSILLMVFFLSIGLLIDVPFIVQHWKSVAVVLAIVTVLKTAVNVMILHLILDNPWDRSFHSGVVMAQVGEFSFIIVAAGLAAHVITGEAYRLMIAVIALSLVISPMWLAIARKLHDMALGKKSG